MALSSILARERQRDNYVVAFLGANPGEEPPLVVYEKGWWTIRRPALGGYASRFRTRELEIMTARLRERVVDLNKL